MDYVQLFPLQQQMKILSQHLIFYSIFHYSIIYYLSYLQNLISFHLEFQMFEVILEFMFFLFHYFHFFVSIFNFMTLLYSKLFKIFIYYFNWCSTFMTILVIIIIFLIFMNLSIHPASLNQLITVAINFIEYFKIYFMLLQIYYCKSLIFHFDVLTIDSLEIIMILFFKRSEELNYFNFIKHLMVLKSFYLKFIILQAILIYFMIKELFVNFVNCFINS